MNFPDMLERVYMVYWESVERPSWKNAYTDDLLKYFQWELPDGIRIFQVVQEAKFLNVNRRSTDYQAQATLIDKMREHKIRRFPLIVLNYNFHSYVYVIDSDYRFRQFTEGFSALIRRQFTKEYNVSARVEIKKEQPVQQEDVPSASTNSVLPSKQLEKNEHGKDKGSPIVSLPFLLVLIFLGLFFVVFAVFETFMR